MAESLYMRLRGRVLGPFDEEKLRSLARRGQLSRLHQLSSDGVNWVPASSYPDLFIVEDGRRRAAGQMGANASPVQNMEYAIPGPGALGNSNTGTAGQAAPPAERPWYYETDGREQGPVSKSTLREMVRTGKLQPSNQVWTESMPKWAFVSQVMDFADLCETEQVATTPSQTQEASHSDDLPDGLCRVVVDSRPWILTISIITLGCAVLGFIGSFIMMLNGASEGVPVIVVAGLSGLVTNVLTGVGGFFLFSYASKLTALRYNKAPVVLERALTVLRTFWVYVAILMVVGTTFVAIVFVWTIAVVGSVPGAFNSVP